MATVLERLNFAIKHAMETDKCVFLLGEDILDPYGGAFKVTRGLSTEFPERVLSTPISEAAIVGIASGMAMRGLRPVVEIMFGDFVTLISDQLMGGRRGYGPTHSQSLEKIFLGVPGLKVVAPNTLGDPAGMLSAAICDDDPVLFVEHKLLYSKQLMETGKGEMVDYQVEQTKGIYPTITLHPLGNASLTIACYGYNFELARNAALDLLMEHEIFTEIILFSQLSPFSLEPLFSSVEHTRKLLTVEEATLSMGWGAEVLARTSEMVCGVHTKRVAAMDLPIANARNLEDVILPSTQGIVEAALTLVDE
jgi:pyruvate/2-oxoglutarate/acetoin dehydrogenase E1 component